MTYSLALNHGSAKSAKIIGRVVNSFGHLFHVQLEFLQRNEVVGLTVLYIGDGESNIVREVAPINGEAFDTIKFVMESEASDAHQQLLLTSVSFKS